MKKYALAAVLAAALAAPALAEGGDMAQLTCGEMLASDADSIGVIMFWIDGYLSHKTGNTIIDVKGITDNTQKIAEYCAANPTAKVLEYVEAATSP